MINYYAAWCDTPTDLIKQEIDRKEGVRRILLGYQSRMDEYEEISVLKRILKNREKAVSGAHVGEGI